MNTNSFSFSRRELARLAIGAAVVLGGLGAAPLGAAAQDEVVAAGQTAVVVDGPLNLRYGAGLGYGVIESLATGDYVEIQSGPTSADGYQWYLVYVDATGSTGYVAGDFLGPVSGGAFSIGDTVYVDTDVLNVRSGPGTGYGVIDSIGYGTNGLVVDGPVFADGYTWYMLDYVGGASDGWVAGDFLTLGSTGGGFAIGDTVMVTSDYVNIRSGPGLGYAVTGAFAYGDQSVIIDGPVYADGYTWYQVQYAGAYNGWVAGEFLGYVSGGGFGIGDTVYVTSGPLNVRSGPGLGYAITDSIAYGTNGLILDGPVYADGYTWYEINYVGGGYDGWVAGEFLALA
jgi:N-acetylmuramoyl-L-alanine amidase